MPDEQPQNPETVVITKADLTTLQRSYTLLDKLLGHKTAGMTAKRALKEIDPSIPIPEIDIAEPLVAEVNNKITAAEERANKLQEQIDKLNEERTNERELDDLRKKLDKAQREHRLTDEGMAEVRKIMAERNVADPEIAARYVVSEIEKPQPVAGSNFAPSDANIFGIDGKSEDLSTKELHENPTKWLDKAVPAILAEFEQQDAA
jgi:hypothetical protein